MIGFVLAISSSWAFDYFGMSCFEQIIFHLKVPLEGTNTQFVKDWFRKCFLKGMICAAVMWIPCIFLFYRRNYGVICKTVFAVCMILAVFRVGIVEFVWNLFCRTDLYEKYYVDGKM